MNNIVILCGANNSGKTSTLKGFFRIDQNTDSPEYYVERKLDGRTVCAVSFGSPQEQSKFCNVLQVQENINSRIRECDEKATNKPYFLIIPFTMSSSRKRKKKLNEDCICKPIEELKKRFNVFVIYLRKTNTHHRNEKDALMESVEAMKPYILTTKDNYDKSKELEKFLIDYVFK